MGNLIYVLKNTQYVVCISLLIFHTWSLKKIVNTVKGHEYNANTPGVHICFKIAIVHVTHSLRTLLHVHAYIFNTYTQCRFFSYGEGGACYPPPKKKISTKSYFVKAFKRGNGWWVRSFLLCKYKSHYQLHQFSYNSIWPVYYLFQFPLTIIFRRPIHCFLKNTFSLRVSRVGSFIHPLVKPPRFDYFLLT